MTEIGREGTTEGAVLLDSVAGAAGIDVLEEAARISEAICTDGDDEADAVRERSGFDSRSGPGAESLPAPDATPFVAGEAIAADRDRQVRNRR